jgi:hypothetical protein
MAASIDFGQSTPHSNPAAVSIIENSYSKYFENCFITGSAGLHSDCIVGAAVQAREASAGYVNWRHMISIRFFLHLLKLPRGFAYGSD